MQVVDAGSEITLRRLNQREYANSVRHLFGFDVAHGDVPEDGEVGSFDTVGAEQFFTSIHFDKYLDLGRKVAKSALRLNTRGRKPAEAMRQEAERSITQSMRKNLAELDRQMALKKAGAGWQEMGFKDEGEMEIIFQQWDSRAEMPRRYLQYAHVDRGVYISDVAKRVGISRHVDIRGEFVVRIHGGIVGEPDELRKVIRVSGRDRIRGTLKMAGTPEHPQTVELRARQPMGRIHLSANIRENQPDNTVNTMRGYLNRLEGNGDRVDPRAAIWIDWMEIDGPYYPDTRPLFEILFPGLPTGKGKSALWGDAHAEELIAQFAFEAFRRRTPDPKYLTALFAGFTANRAAGMKYENAMIETMGIILASPGFLFLHEADALPDAGNRLDNRELAVRLSYFLWSAPPDDTLYAADLDDPATYAKQVDRLLADPKAEAFRDGFISQWAELKRFDAITIDNRTHFRFNEGLRQDAKQEVREFFGTLIAENLPARKLIDSDFVTINPALAIHYGIPGVTAKNERFQKVMLPADSPRGGLATQAAFLITGSNGERSSPVIRGALIMEKLLHDKPAPPPPNVPELGSASGEPKSNREMVELHQKQAVCASCHKKMDVIGFGLENFDTIGRWRDSEKVGRKQRRIEPGGTLPNGVEFADVKGLKALLLKEDRRLAEELVEAILAYALGRTTEFSDSLAVEAVLARLEPDGYRLRAMIREIALSPLFTSK
jgi:hypothetical protein